MDSSDIQLLGEQGFVVTSLAERMYPNMGSFAGQLAFLPWNVSPKNEVRITRDKAVRASRQAIRTSEHLRGGLEKHVDMVVGPGLMVRPTPDWDLLPMFSREQQRAFSNGCRAWFNNWAYDKRLTQDTEGHYDFGGMMWMAYANATGPEAESVGAILQDDDRMVSLGAAWSTHINVIHPARLQTPPLLAGLEEELNIFQGKQLDPDGRWEGLYILKKHPADFGLNWNDYAFVPRETASGRAQAWHYFDKTEGGSQRAITKLTTSISRVFQVDKLYEGSVGSAVLNSLFSMFVKSGSDPKTIAERLAPNPMYENRSAFDLRAQFYKDSRIRFGGQRVPVLPDGDELVMSAVNRAAQDPTELFNIFLREFASVTGTTFEQLANNWSDANYSAARAALLDLWRTITRKRIRFSHVPSLIYSAVIEEAIIDRQRIVLPPGAPDFYEMREAYTRCTWMGPGMGQIDPEKEATANQINLQIKATNRDRIWSEQGLYYYDGFVQYAEEIKEAEDLGFELDVPMPGTPGADGQAPANGAAPAKPKKPNNQAANAELDDRSGRQRRGPAKTSAGLRRQLADATQAASTLGADLAKSRARIATLTREQQP